MLQTSQRPMGSDKSLRLFLDGPPPLLFQSSVLSAQVIIKDLSVQESEQVQKTFRMLVYRMLGKFNGKAATYTFMTSFNSCTEQ